MVLHLIDRAAQEDRENEEEEGRGGWREEEHAPEGARLAVSARSPKIGLRPLRLHVCRSCKDFR